MGAKHRPIYPARRAPLSPFYKGKNYLPKVIRCVIVKMYLLSITQGRKGVIGGDRRGKRKRRATGGETGEGSEVAMVAVGAGVGRGAWHSAQQGHQAQSCHRIPEGSLGQCL